jgi:phosphate-selective porin
MGTSMGLLASILIAAMPARAEAQAFPGVGEEPGDLPRELSLQETEQERLRRVEEQLKRQQDTIDEQQRKIGELERLKGKKGFSLYATFTDGFHLMDDEGNFDMHLGGRVILHYRNVYDLPPAFVAGPGAPPAYPARTQPNTFYINSVYLIFEGTIFRDWGYRVTGEVSTTTGGPNARLESSYVEWKRFREFSIRAGNFKAPMSVDTISSPLFLDEIERSMLAQFVPSFELGIMVYGSLWDSLLTYQVAVTNGRSYLAGVGRTRNDDDQTKEVVGRLTVAPFVQDTDNVLRFLRLGISGTTGAASAVPLQANFSVASTELAVTWLVPNTNDFLDGHRVRAAAELAWSYGAVSFRMEGLYRGDRVTRPSAAIDERLVTKAWYAQAGVILTGEEKILDARIRPAHPFDLATGDFGAFEFVARVARVTLDQGTLLDLATDLTNQTNRMGSATVGFNWWPVQNIRISIDGIREDYYGGVVFILPGGPRITHLYGLLARFQVDF